jgi:methionyl-tRNA formyltransferase
VNPAAAVSRAPCLVFAYHELGYVCLQTLIELGVPIVALLTHRDDPNEEIWWRSCAELANRHAIAVDYEVVFDADWTARIAAWAPAVIYSFNYRRMLPQAVLDCARLGAFNLHPSKLPAYRGRVPINWALINGEHEIGITLHHMVAKPDAGDIVAQETIAVTDDDTALTVYRKLIPVAARLIREFHPLIAAGRAPRRPQDLAAGSYYGRRTPADGRIEWGWSARRIANLVRAVTHPYPGAFCLLNGRRLWVWRVAVASEDGTRGAPGQILAHGASGIEVAAGTGSLFLQCVQLEGAAQGPANEVLPPALIDAAGKLQ